MENPEEWTEQDIPLLLWGLLPIVIILIISFLVGSLVNIALVRPVAFGCMLVYIVVLRVIYVVKNKEKGGDGDKPKV